MLSNLYQEQERKHVHSLKIQYSRKTKQQEDFKKHLFKLSTPDKSKNPIQETLPSILPR